MQYACLSMGVVIGSHLEGRHVDLTEVIKKLGVRTESRHTFLHDQFRQTLTTAGMTDNKEGNIQLDTHHLKITR